MPCICKEIFRFNNETIINKSPDNVLVHWQDKFVILPSVIETVCLMSHHSGLSLSLKTLLQYLQKVICCDITMNKPRSYIFII